MRVARRRLLLAFVLVTALLLPAIGRPLIVRAQSAGASITTDKQTYSVGDPISICYTVPGPGPVTITDSESGPVLSGNDDGTGGCTSASITPPTGQECETLSYQSSRGSGSTQTCFQVAAPSGVSQSFSSSGPLPANTPICQNGEISLFPGLTCAQPQQPSGAGGGGWTFCANEGGYCEFFGDAQVRFGANGYYTYRDLPNGTLCSDSVFGDPDYGVRKQCWYKTIYTSPYTPPRQSYTPPPQNGIPIGNPCSGLGSTYCNGSQVPASGLCLLFPGLLGC